MSSSEIRVDTIKSRTGLGTVTINSSGLQFSGIITSENRVDVKSYDGTPGRLDLYCESSNVHYARIQAPDHADFSGNLTLTLPNTAGTLLNSDVSGNVGIGTNNPTELLHLSADSAHEILLKRGGGSPSEVRFANEGNTAVISNNTNGISFETGTTPSETVRINASGSVGLGTGVPLAKLDIDSATGSADQALLVSDTASIPQNTDFTAQISSYGQGSSGLSGSKGGLFVHAGFNRDIDIARFSSIGSGYIDVTRMVIKDSGDVGIGTTVPGSRLTVEGSAGSNSRIHIKSTDIGQISFDGSGSGLLLTAAGMNTSSKYTPAIQFGSTDSDFTTTNPKVFAAINAIASDGFFADTDGGMDLAFYTTGANPGTGQTITERMRILSSGGLTFNGDTATANALDDYEEGTWTPVFRGATTAGSYTYGSQVGNYTKIGNKVTVTATLLDITTVSAGSGTLEISGLPFAQAGDFSSGDIYMAHFDVDNSTVSLSSRIDGSNSHILAVETRDALSGSVVQVTDKASNSADIIATITYFTNS